MCTFCSLFSQGLNNIIHIDFDYKKEFIYWVDSTRPSGRKINRMRLNGSDLKVPQNLYAVPVWRMVVCAILTTILGFSLYAPCPSCFFPCPAQFVSHIMGNSIELQTIALIVKVSSLFEFEKLG